MEHHFNVEFAAKYGIEEAIFINNLQFWIIKNKASGKHLHDGHTWTYNSMEAFSKLFPYMSLGRIRHTLDSLVDQQVIIKGNYNSKQYDRTSWYAFADENLFIDQQMHLLKTTNGFAESDKPIPYSKPDINNSNTLFPDDKPKELSDAELKKRQKELAQKVKEEEKKNKQEKQVSLWQLQIKTWEEFYLQVAKVKPVINGRECAALKSISAALKKLMEENLSEWNEETIPPGLQLLFKSAYGKDDWLRNNFTLANINSQINPILKIIINGGQATNQSRTGQVQKSTSGTIAHLDQLYRGFEE